IQRIEHADADYLYGRYQTPASKTDLSQIFMEKSLSLINPTGTVGFITTSQWMTTDYGRKIRSLLVGGYLHQLVHFGSMEVFQHTYIRDLTGMDKAFVLPRSAASELGIEAGITFPYAYRGEEVHAYVNTQPDARVIYPYRDRPDGSPVLIEERQMRKEFPIAYA